MALKFSIIQKDKKFGMWNVRYSQYGREQVSETGRDFSSRATGSCAVIVLRGSGAGKGAESPFPFAAKSASVIGGPFTA